MSTEIPHPETPASPEQHEANVISPEERIRRENGQKQRNTKEHQQKQVEELAAARNLALGGATDAAQARIRMIMEREERNIKTIQQNRDSGGWFGGFHRLLTTSDPHGQDIARCRQVVGTMRVARQFLEQSQGVTNILQKVILLNRARRVSGLREMLVKDEQGRDMIDPERDTIIDTNADLTYATIIEAGQPWSPGVNRIVGANDQERYKVEQEAITVSRDTAISAAVGLGTLGAGLAAGAAARGGQVAAKGFWAAARQGATAGGVMGGAEGTVKAVEDVQRGATSVAGGGLHILRDTAFGAGLGGALGAAFRAIPGVGSWIDRLTGNRISNAASSTANTVDDLAGNRISRVLSADITSWSRNPFRRPVTRPNSPEALQTSAGVRRTPETVLNEIRVYQSSSRVPPVQLLQELVQAQNPRLNSTQLLRRTVAQEPVLAETGGFFRVRAGGRPTVVSVIADEAHYARLLRDRADSARHCAEMLGIPMEQMRPETLRMFIFFHEWGHAHQFEMQFLRGHRSQGAIDRAVQAWRSLLNSERSRLPVPNVNPADLNRRLRQNGILTNSRLREAQNIAYRNLPSEQYADEFAVQMMRRNGLIPSARRHE